MKLLIYKGFDIEFLSNLDKNPLVENNLEKKIDVLAFDRNTRKLLDIALLSIEDDAVVWATYEEYSLIKSRVDDAIQEDGLEVTIYRNNLYPDYYPLQFKLDDQLAQEIEKTLTAGITDDSSSSCQLYLSVYNSLVRIEDSYFGSFYNYEYDKGESVIIRDFYPHDMILEEGQDKTDLNLFLNEDVDSYLRDLRKIKRQKPKIIGIQSTNGETSKRILESLFAYCLHCGIRAAKYHEILAEDIERENELINIARKDIKIANFSGFRPIQFYKNPDINKEIVEISQSQIIREIIKQAENAYAEENEKRFRDIFITASTGAGKSVMFQIPAVYLAKKYKKLTIIIEPVKALMQDQKERLNKNGYFRVETFNSDLISQIEKEAVLKKVWDGEVDLLYLSPETLLSYSIETIIGERDIGLLIVDEAHIVTTWGVGFRPDYWYLGGYINRLRNQIQTGRKSDRKIYNFPICAFTATAINGGEDDSVSDTIISLYMENPIKYIGYVRRDNIGFEIVNKSNTKISKSEYEEKKTKDMDTRIKKWLANGTKTVVYFPFATYAGNAQKGVLNFSGITTDKKIGIYTGRNIDGKSAEAFNEAKRETFEKFRKGKTTIMLATKAFGMGVDVDDIELIYHYAVTGNLCDYVQEIGRAARKKTMHGLAITDSYYNDITFMKILFGMSQIKQYQIKKVLEGIYDTYKNKNGARSFLISPESFTYIFKGEEDVCINQLKTCLLMLEKDFYDKYNFKVLISRPQSVFTKAFIVIKRDVQDNVLNSKFGKCFRFIEKGRYKERQADGSLLSDIGDVYSIDLKGIWEEFYPNISFPQFKYWYFNNTSTSKNKVDIMPSIRDGFAPRQKVTIEPSKEYLLCDLRDNILTDFEYIADTLYAKFRKQYFSLEEFAKLISEKYGITKARMIANSLFDLVDPKSYCVKYRENDSTGKTVYSLSNGNLKELLRKPIIKSRLISNLSSLHTDNYSGYLSLSSDEKSSTALKLLSIFEYITYEIVGGEEPEIFIRLNDPNKVKGIVLGNIRYSNNYVTKAKKKQERDVNILLRFFNELKTDTDRWDYIENYFLGYDVLNNRIQVKPSEINLNKSINRKHSYPTNEFKKWSDILNFFDKDDRTIIEKLDGASIPIPEYLETKIKKSDLGDDIMMSWPSKNTVLCSQETSDENLDLFFNLGWNAYRFYDVDYDKLKGDLK